MNQFDYRQFYRRNRPHIHPPGATLFVTFRLAGSIPKAAVQSYLAERELREKELKKLTVSESQITPGANYNHPMIDFHRKWFSKFDEILDKAKKGPMWLAKPDIRKTVIEKVLTDDNHKYQLYALCVMCNHVHIVFKPHINEENLKEVRTSNGIKFVSNKDTLAEIMQSLKGSTARKCNLLLKRTGPFWERESFDHVIRNDEGFHRAVRYTLNNPVKARLVRHWSDWPGSYPAPNLRGLMEPQI